MTAQHKSWYDKARRYRALPAAERALLLEACWNLALARIALRVAPFRWFVRNMQLRTGEPDPGNLSLEQTRVASNIRRAVRLAARHVPWRAVCLPQSLAAKTMLGRRGIPAILYLGVRQQAASAPEFDAHAWVRAGLVEVTPSQEIASQRQGRFVVVAMFS